MRASKVDANQPEIIEALRAAGATVFLTHKVGQGFPDAVVGYNGRNYLIEIKTMRGTLTKDEREFMADWKGQYAVVRNVKEALGLIGR